MPNYSFFYCFFFNFLQKLSAISQINTTNKIVVTIGQYHLHQLYFRIEKDLNVLHHFFNLGGTSTF